MIKNYFKIAWRNLVRNKSYTFINIGGLSVALAVFLIIILFVRFEFSYDSFFSNADRIYRIAMVNEDAANSNGVNLQLPEPVAGELKKLYPEVKQAVRVTGPFSNVLLEGKNKIYSDTWASVDASFFSIFDFPFITGTPSAALDEPQSVVITRSLALKLFGTVDVMGKKIIYNNDKAYTVTGVMQDLPGNTHFNIQAFAHREGYSNAMLQKWNYYTGYVYIKLAKATQAASLQSKLPDYIKEHQNYPEGMKPPSVRLTLQPVKDIHLHPRGRDAESSRLFYIQVLLIVAGLILVVACINYMNMATARSARRAREIGIRKTVGATKKQVIFQVMLESVVTCFLAFLLSLVLVELFKPMALRYFNISLGSVYIFTPYWIGFLAGLILIVSFLSGAYAAFYLASFSPFEVLKGSGLQSGRRSAGFRKILVVTQFGISTAIIIASLLISSQMEFVRTERLNGNDEQVMVVHNNSKSLSKQFNAFKNELLKHSSVASVSAGTIPTQIGITYGYSDSTGNKTTVYNLRVQYDYLKTMGLKLLSGRSFDPRRSEDSTNAMILNKSYAQKLGLKQAKGQSIPHSNGRLIGIVQDFHSQTLFEPITPVAISIMHPNSQFGGRMTTILVRLKKGHIAQGITDVRSVWTDFEPAYPLNFSFLDQLLDKDYQAEMRLSRIFDVFSVFSILIACLGLFGLAAYTAERRTKEIGIRKVVGATVPNIVSLLSKDFLKLVALGFIIAVPIAWYAMNRWLQKFAYKIEVGPGIFLLAGGMALLVALATISWQSIRAALANPVDSLRSE